MKVIKQNNKPIIHILFKLLGVGFLCFAGLFLYEVFPQFITLSIPQPSDDDYPLQSWAFPTYSIISPARTRYFVWREFTILSHEGLPEKEYRQSISKYYDQQLLKLGWTKSNYDPNSYTNCGTGEIFPEAFFLPPSQDFSQDGYAVYKRKIGFALITSKENDEVCLAVWRHWDNVPGIFNVVISTIKPSPLTWVLFRNEFQFSR